MSNVTEPPSSNTKDPRLQKLVGTVEEMVADYASYYVQQIKRLSEIGIALSSEHNLDKLLEKIVDEARRFTYADAGTLYIKEPNHLRFTILQNESMNTKMGGTSGNAITLPPVPLSKSNVSAYVALTGETINIPDVYEAEGFDFTGPRKYDQATGYRSKSMLVVPMKNHEDEIIGVLQLLNAMDKNGEVIPFSHDFVSLTQSLASQAAVAITNAQLIKDMENLFDSFVKVMATAIDERSPYTAGHIRRVAELGYLMCEIINDTTEGPFANIQFTEDQMKEMLVAGWMHDVGKVATPIYVVDKATKLQTIYDRVEMLKQRFDLIATLEEKHWLERELEMIRGGASASEIEEEAAIVRGKLTEIQDDREFCVKSNTGGEFLTDEHLQRLAGIAGKTYQLNGTPERYLSDDELANLSIRKGTLLDSERKIIQNHATVTLKMLGQIPFTKKLSKVPQYAGGHHECLDGSGYPKGLKGEDLPLGARILNLVDFYEALSAADRPYKKAMPMDRIITILRSEVEKGKMDKDLLDLFVDRKVYDIYDERCGKKPCKEEWEQKVVEKPIEKKSEKEVMGRNPLASH